MIGGMICVITLQFEIQQQSLKRTDHEFLVNKSKNIIQAHFKFSGELWEENSEKYVIFKDSWNNKTRIHLDENSCKIPDNVLEGDFFKLAIYAGDRITTNYIIIPLSSTISPQKSNTPISENSNIFNSIFESLRKKYDDLVLEENKLYCYSGDECLKIINFDDLILNTYPTKDYVESELNKKYDDFTYENGSLLCFINGELRKKIPITGIEEFYTRKEIDEQFNEVNNRLDKFIIDGEVIETDNSLLLNFN